MNPKWPSQLPNFTTFGSSRLLFSTSPKKVLCFLLSVEHFRRAFSLGFSLRPLGAQLYFEHNQGRLSRIVLGPNGSRDHYFLRFRDVASEEMKNLFDQLLPAPHNSITRSFNHRIYYGAFTLSCSAEISQDADNFLFG